MSTAFFARSYEEARQIELAQETGRGRFLAHRAFIRCWLPAANLSLKCIEWLFFQGKRNSLRDKPEIVVYTVGTLGDNVLLLSAIAAIKRRFPDSKLTAIANCDGFSDFPARQILGNSPLIDRLITLPRHPVQRIGRRIVVDAPDAIGVKCDLFVNLSPFGNRGWIGAVIREMLFARWLKARRVVGFRMSTYTRKQLFHKVQHRFMQNEARRAAVVLRELSIEPVYGEDLLPRDTKAEEKVTSLLARHRSQPGQPVAVLNPGAKLVASHWPADRYGDVARWLSEHYGCLVCINGTEAEREICEGVIQASGHSAISLAGELTIVELTELLRRSALLVSNNTGPMTLSAMTGTPTVVVASTRFSPTFYMPVSEQMVWVFSFDENCYSYDDGASPAKDLLNITFHDIQRAVQMLDPFTGNRYKEKAGG